MGCARQGITGRGRGRLVYECEVMCAWHDITTTTTTHYSLLTPLFNHQILSRDRMESGEWKFSLSLFAFCFLTSFSSRCATKILQKLAFLFVFSTAQLLLVYKADDRTRLESFCTWTEFIKIIFFCLLFFLWFRLYLQVHETFHKGKPESMLHIHRKVNTGTSWVLLHLHEYKSHAIQATSTNLKDVEQKNPKWNTCLVRSHPLHRLRNLHLRRNPDQ